MLRGGVLGQWMCFSVFCPFAISLGVLLWFFSNGGRNSLLSNGWWWCFKGTHGFRSRYKDTPFLCYTASLITTLCSTHLDLNLLSHLKYVIVNTSESLAV